MGSVTSRCDVPRGGGVGDIGDIGGIGDTRDIGDIRDTESRCVSVPQVGEVGDVGDIRPLCLAVPWGMLGTLGTLGTSSHNLSQPNGLGEAVSMSPMLGTTRTSGHWLGWGHWGHRATLCLSPMARGDVGDITGDTGDIKPHRALVPHLGDIEDDTHRGGRGHNFGGDSAKNADPEVGG